MKYDVSGRKRNPECKNIGAFYGLNRTGKINDFQFSDMENMDAGSFPFVETRRERSVFWGAGKEEQPMQMICSDTDVYDDYKLTGVTDSGGFIYRGKKYLEEGYGGNICMLEHMGDYVFLPSKKVVTVGEGVASESEFNSSDSVLFDYMTEECAYEFPTDGITYFDISRDTMRGILYEYADVRDYKFIDFFFDNAVPGLFFTLDTFAREGRYDDDLPDNWNIYQEYKDTIPEDVYMVIDQVYYEEYRYGVTDKSDRRKVVFYGDSDFSYHNAVKCVNEHEDNYVNLFIKFTARHRSTGELYDITPHFKCFEMEYPAGSSAKASVVSKDTFACGLVGVDLDGIYPQYNDYYWQDCHINIQTPVMLLGASYGGRLFTCDNLGVTVYFSASGSYDFEAGDSLGGAGFVSCAEPGKWVAMCVYNEALYVFKRNGMYRIYSGDGLTYYLDRIADVGAIDREGVCVVDNVLYFLSDNGIYQFTGSYPQPLPDSLGRRYTAGTLGGDDGKLFASLGYKEGGEEKHELIVWHSDKQIFSRHDDFCAKQFLAALGGVYALAKDGTVMKMEGDRCALPFSLTTKKYFFGFSKKGANGAQIYFEFEGESFEVSVSHDGGEFVPCSVVSDGRVRYIPVRFRKCDELMLRIQGEGIFTLKGISFLVYQGGNVKQNHMIKW